MRLVLGFSPVLNCSGKVVGLSLERVTPVVDTGSKCLNVRDLHGASGDAGTT